MKDEATVQDELRIEGNNHSAMLLRNNSGLLYNKQGSPVRFGLGNTSEKINKIRKTSDLIGPMTVVITDEMVGHEVAIFSAIEVKKEGWKYKGTATEEAQLNFINKINKMGGVATFAQSTLDYLIAIKHWYGRFKT